MAMRWRGKAHKAVDRILAAMVCFRKVLMDEWNVQFASALEYFGI
jgi:hypothetical protein